MKSYDVLCFGSCVIDQIENSSKTTLGGDAANQALIVKRLGLHPVLCACTGQDEAAHHIRQILNQHHISTDYLVSDSSWETTHSLIHLDENKERSFAVTGGAHRLMQRQHFPFELLDQVKAISLGSMFTLHLLEEDGLKDIFETAKQKNCLIFCDTSKDRHHKGLQKVKEFLPYIDYFMPSYDEAAELTGKTDPDEMASILFEHGANAVVIKQGSKGAVLYKKDAKTSCDAYPCNVVDTTGAGDHFCAGFIASILSGLSEVQALHNGCYLGARACESYGTNDTIILSLPYPLEKTNS